MGSPERASCAGKTPRVISRSASSAAVNESTKGSSRGRPALVRRRPASVRQLSQAVGERPQVGEDLARDGLLEPAPLGIAGADQPATGVAQLAGAAAQLLDLSGQLDREPRVAERQSGLVGQVGQQPVLRRRSGCPAGIVTVMLPRRSPRCRTGISSPGRSGSSSSVRAASAPSVGAGVHVEHDRGPVALTARAAASATAGSSVAGSGLSPRRRLKSASAS